MHVFTVNRHGEPMMPCHPAVARKLLKSKRARVYKKYPFTILIKDRTEFTTQVVELKIDPGSKTTGIAIVKHGGTPLKDAAALNATRYRIGEELTSIGLPIRFCSGGQTKRNRVLQQYPKVHWIDAACAGADGDAVKLDPSDSVLLIHATGRGSRQMCLMDTYGFPRTSPKSVKRIHGFQTGDMVRLVQDTGKYRGTYTGKVVVRERGYFDIVVSSKDKTKITASWRKFTLIQRFDGYQYGFATA